MLLFMLFVSTANFMSAVSGKVRSDEEKLLEYLFHNYNPSARPVLNSSKTVPVSLQFALLQIQELNVRSQVFTTTGLLILDWKDERLTWSEEVSSLDEIVIDGRAIWKPEFAVINGAEGIYEDFGDFQAVLKSDGSIHWEPGGVFKTMCEIDITFYPFDSQSCNLQFGAWSYYTSKMNLTTNGTDVGLESYEKNGEWQITGTAVSRHEFAFECCPDERFSNILFTINLSRRHTFYIMNVILPGIMTSVVLLSIFFCTPSQKVHIGMAALLSFRLFLLNVADTIPRTSDHVPMLSIYLTSTMAITTLAMVATVFVTNLHDIRDRPVPLWARQLLTSYVARVLCMVECLTPPVPDESGIDLDKECARYTHKNPYAKTQVEEGMASGYGRERREGKVKYRLVTTGDNEQIIEQETVLDGQSFDDNLSTTHSPSHSHTQDTYVTCEPSSSQAPMINSRGFLVSPTDRRNDRDTRRRMVPAPSNTPADYSKDWVHVAAVCDRLFFWFCLIFIIITTLLLFHPLTTSRYFNLPLVDSQPAL